MMRMSLKFVITLSVVMLMLAACGGDGGTGARGEVTLTSPLDSTVVYASALYISGTASDVDGGLTLRVVDESGVVLTEAMITEPEASWSAELIHGYTGLPQNMTVQVLPSNVEATEENPVGPYASVNVILAALEHRPEGAFADVLFPQAGDDIGGDQVEISGRASGLEDQTFTVTLVGADGVTIDMQTVTLASPYPIDDQPWTVDLALSDYTGSAVITVDFGEVDGEPLQQTVPVIVSSAAG